VTYELDCINLLPIDALGVELNSAKQSPTPAKGESKTKAVTLKVKATDSTMAESLSAIEKASRANPTQVRASPSKLIV